MFSPEMYELLDFGDGRRLERFGSMVLDRPSPAAEGIAKSEPDLWQQADARFERGDGGEGRWEGREGLPERWTVQHGRLMMELKRTEFGHLGLFPEQAANWDWLAGRVAEARRPRVLNLFAYTGGSTLAAAAAGAEVVHLDAARNVVAWARRNAALSGLEDRPIRWIADDAMKFVRRELKRDSQYDALVLDPPSYGHGSRGEVWRLSKHLPQLMKMCRQLMGERRQFVLLTCHTPGFGPQRLGELLEEVFDGDRPGAVTAEELGLTATTGRVLTGGVVARWQRGG